MNACASRLNLNHPSRQCRFRHAFAAAHLSRLGNRYGDKQGRLRRRRFLSLRPRAFSPIMQQAAVDAIPTRHRRDIRARLKALRQNSRPLLITPAHMARRPRDQLDPAIAIIAFATVSMSVIMTVILHGDIRRIHGPLGMLSNAPRFGRCDRRVIAVPLTVQLAPFAVKDIDWSEHHINVNVTRDQVKSSPAWDPLALADQVGEQQLHRHFGWPGYGW